MNGLPLLKEIRSVSNFGLSVVNIYFEDGTGIYFARQLVNERLQLAREEIPSGFGEPEMGPTSTGLGQILFYFLEDASGKRSPQDMREVQDWLIKFNVQTVPGVTEVLSLGGEVKQFQVLVRPTDLIRHVKARMEEINKVLPPGIRVVPYYDQATLVARCVRTVTKALFEAAVLIVLIHMAMLGGLRPNIAVLAAIT